MAADLTRVSISLEESLLERFDDFVHERSYGTRSEAIRDLIRDKLLSMESDDERVRIGILSLVLSLSTGRAQSAIGGWLGRAADFLVSSMQTPLGDDHALFVFVLRGSALQLRRYADGVLSMKGVLHGDLRFTGTETDLAGLSLKPSEAYSATPVGD
jgi:CopG family nickel-responsive transcriptional regulator